MSGSSEGSGYNFPTDVSRFADADKVLAGLRGMVRSKGGHSKNKLLHCCCALVYLPSRFWAGYI